MTIPPDGRGVLERREYQNWLANGVHPLAFMVAVGGKVLAVNTFRGAHGGGVLVLHYESGAIGTPGHIFAACALIGPMISSVSGGAFEPSRRRTMATFT